MHQICYDKFMKSKTPISKGNVGIITLSCLLTMKI